MLKKIKFSDIAGMLEKDDMREIIGGCGSTTGSGSNIYGGGGDAPALGSNPFNSSFSGTNYGGFGGANVPGGGVYGSGSITGAGESSYYNGNSYGTNNLNSSTINGAYGTGYFTNSNNGKTTIDPLAIVRFFEFVYASNGVITNNQVNTFINKELTTLGQQQNSQQFNLTLPGTVLKNVTVPNNYKGPSTIPQGVIIDNMTLTFNNISNNVSSGTNNSINNLSWYAMPINGSAAKPIILEAALMSKSVYGGKDLLDSNGLMGWKVAQAVEGVMYEDPSSGFKSVLYERFIAGTSVKQYCYVTAGTEPGDFGDYAADALQTIGISKQYHQSTENAKILKALYGDQLSFAGHSLGGGMAEANARITGESATTFNAAGLSYSTSLLLGTGFVSDTHSYIMVNDPLNLAQTTMPGLTTAGGQKHFVNTNGSSGGHGIDAMIGSLKISQNIK